MTTLSSHVLDVERGLPAEGVTISLFQGQERIAEGRTNADGRVSDLVAGGINAGTYRLEFDVAAYLRAQRRTVPFLRRVTIEFEVSSTDPHYHIPLLMTPYACTSYRGS